MKIVFEGSELKESVIWGKLIEVILINTQRVVETSLWILFITESTMKESEVY